MLRSRTGVRSPLLSVLIFFFRFRTACRGRGPILVLLSAISIHFPTSQSLPSSPFLRFVLLLRLRIVFLLWGWKHVPCGVCMFCHHFNTLHGSSSPHFSSRFGAFFVLVTSLRIDSFRSCSSLGSHRTSGSCMFSACMAFLSSA